MKQEAALLLRARSKKLMLSCIDLPFSRQ